MELLEGQPLPLTRAQRLLLGITALGMALTRPVARSRTLWDWDEVQFAMAVEDYDPADYRPHPPGFPLFIALAKMVRPFLGSDFAALQAVTLAGAMVLFPLLFVLFREFGFPFAVAYSGAILSLFLPNVWFYGGTAFSDVASLAVTIAAAVWLLRGVRDRRALYAGAILLGLAAAIRPQALLLGCAPALLVTWKRRREWRVLAAAMAAGLAVIAVSYLAAALAASSVEDYLASGRKLRDYLRLVDSFLSPERPPLADLAELFFLQAIPGKAFSLIVVIAAAIGAVVAGIRKEGKVWLAAATFLPFQVFAWLMLDYHSVTRYGIAFAPLYALLAAAGVAGLLAWVPGLGRGAGAVVVVLLAVVMARWTYSPLRDVRRDPSPPVMAMSWIGTNVDRSSLIHADPSMIPYARYFLAGRPVQIVHAPTDMGPVPPPADSIVVTDQPQTAIPARRFLRARGRMFEMARQRYFETTILPARAWAELREGWYPPEWDGRVAWVWMGRRSTMLLPPLQGPAALTLRVEPVLEKGAPVVEVSLNGILLERFVAGALIERTWSVVPRADGWNELVVTSDRFVNPARDGYGSDDRDLSLSLHAYDWGPAAP